MKILLQPEAKTISNCELIENQKRLINLMGNFGFRWQKKVKTTKSCTES